MTGAAALVLFASKKRGVNYCISIVRIAAWISVAANFYKRNGKRQ